MATRGFGIVSGMAALLLGLGLALPARVSAHCDTLDGPVVQAAREALSRRSITPVLKWVKPQGEGEVKEAFRKALAVRGAGPEARDLADRYFFETLVRVHRAGESAPYTGLKPAGAPMEPGIAAADRSLETGSVDDLAKRVAAEVAEGIRQRHARALAARKRADQNVRDGRSYVAAYVDFIHYVERLHQAAAGQAAHAEGASTASAETTHAGDAHPEEAHAGH